MAEPDTDGFAIKGAADRAPSPSSEIPPRSPSKTSPRRSRSMSKSQSHVSEEGEMRPSEDDAPPLPDEPVPGSEGDAPPLPDEPLPDTTHDDGWEARCDAVSGHWYFVNRFTGVSQWENPRVRADYTPAPVYSGAPGTEPISSTPGNGAENPYTGSPNEPYLGYNPKIHGDFDPNADYAKFHQPAPAQSEPSIDTADAANLIGNYAQAAAFNRRSGAFQGGDKDADYHNDENKSKRQMHAYFDVERAANEHDGRSLKAERANKRMSKKQVKAFNEQRRAKKEQKRREFLLS
ncbi:hypothetical protein AAFC00_000591 [Neodothiora populina]|uniref:WW domain-containing protein n=1 Tax=Neodothiora populina TaxID=2781224 RepID=A0ABR3PDF9_9PEZI